MMGGRRYAVFPVLPNFQIPFLFSGRPHDLSSPSHLHHHQQQQQHHQQPHHIQQQQQHHQQQQQQHSPPLHQHHAAALLHHFYGAAAGGAAAAAAARAGEAKRKTTSSLFGKSWCVRVCLRPGTSRLCVSENGFALEIVSFLP